MATLKERYAKLQEEAEWLNYERIEAVGFDNYIVRIFTDYLGYGFTADLVKKIVDKETNPFIVNAAKQLMYRVEQWNIVDIPETTEYNNYKPFHKITEEER
jgi:hypothetical protein